MAENVMVDPGDRSPTIEKLAEALAAAQAEIAPAERNATNPHRGNRYADLSSVWEACRKALSSHGLAVVQLPRWQSEQLLLRTELLHASGQWIASVYPIWVPHGAEGDPQRIGSALTYARRYSLAAMVGVAPDDDDAAAAARSAPRASAVAPPARPAPAAPETWAAFVAQVVAKHNEELRNELAILGVPRERRAALGDQFGVNQWQVTNALVTRALAAGLLRDRDVEDEHSPGKRDRTLTLHAAARLFREEPGRVKVTVRKYLDEKLVEAKASLDPDAAEVGYDAAGGPHEPGDDSGAGPDRGDAYEGPEGL